MSISFEEIKLPPFQDILVLGKNSAQGKIGLFRALELIAPESFKMIAINKRNIEALFVSKSILDKIPEEKVLEILDREVFPHISRGELISVDFKIHFSVKNIVAKSYES